MLCGSLDRRGVWGRMDTRICTAKSINCSHITIKTLYIGYIPKQKKKSIKKKKLKRSESMAEQKRLFPRNSLGV